MGNHFHCLLRNRPDLVRLLSDVQVVLYGWRLSAASRAADGKTKKISRKQLQRMLDDPERIREYRRRLSSISWFMSYLKQPIAVQANHQDGVTGRFWEGRFHSEKITSLQQLLAAMVYIDLNPVRAGLAETPEESQYTGVFERIRAQHQRQKWAARAQGRARQTNKQLQERLDEEMHAQIDDWLSPVEFDEQLEPTIAVTPDATDHPGTTDLDSAAAEVASWMPSPRASNRGILPISLEKYLMLVDWTGRQLRRDKFGKIPDELPPILARLGLSNAAAWLTELKNYAERLIGRYSAPANQAMELQLCGSSDSPDAACSGQAFL
jgi:hypothetical protein